MVFSSIPFLYYFLPLVLVCYFCVPFRFKNLILLLFSLAFYSWGEPTYIFLMALSILLGYIEGLLIEKVRHSRFILAASCCIHLGFLIYFKYADFLIENINALGLSLPLLHVTLPIGISFYTFQIISYLIDVYRNDCSAQKNLISFGTYVSMFPQLIAGPIVRYKDIALQLASREHSIEKAALGIRMFIFGLSKKVLLANSLGELCNTFQNSTDRSVLYYWLYAFAFAMQIYFDFSGYSDMAVGLGNIFGFRFQENFHYPYLSKSITEFWRRWHMTLSSWFRDYVYIPLGGNRVKKSRWLLNIAIVWFLTGLWHGASWNFVIWGMLFALLLIAEKEKLSTFLQKHTIFSHIYVILAVTVSFVIFNASSINEAFESLKIMFTGGTMPLVSNELLYYLRSYSLTLMISAIGTTSLPKQLIEHFREKPRANSLLNILEPAILVLLMLMVNAYLIQDSYNPFLYFRF